MEPLLRYVLPAKIAVAIDQFADGHRRGATIALQSRDFAPAVANAYKAALTIEGFGVGGGGGKDVRVALNAAAAKLLAEREASRPPSHPPRTDAEVEVLDRIEAFAKDKRKMHRRLIEEKERERRSLAKLIEREEKEWAREMDRRNRGHQLQQQQQQQSQQYGQQYQNGAPSNDNGVVVGSGNKYLELGGVGSSDDTLSGVLDIGVTNDYTAADGAAANANTKNLNDDLVLNSSFDTEEEVKKEDGKVRKGSTTKKAMLAALDADIARLEALCAAGVTDEERRGIVEAVIVATAEAYDAEEQRRARLYEEEDQRRANANGDGELGNNRSGKSGPLSPRQEKREQKEQKLREKERAKKIELPRPTLFLDAVGVRCPLHNTLLYERFQTDCSVDARDCFVVHHNTRCLNQVGRIYACPAYITAPPPTRSLGAVLSGFFFSKKGEDDENIKKSKEGGGADNSSESAAAAASSQRVECPYALCEQHLKVTFGQWGRIQLHTAIIQFTRLGPIGCVASLVFILEPILYFPIVQTCLLFLTCHQSFACLFPHCWDTPDGAFIVAAAVVATVGAMVGIGIPFVLYVALRRRHAALGPIFHKRAYQHAYRAAESDSDAEEEGGNGNGSNTNDTTNGSNNANGATNDTPIADKKSAASGAADEKTNTTNGKKPSFYRQKLLPSSSAATKKGGAAAAKYRAAAAAAADAEADSDAERAEAAAEALRRKFETDERYFPFRIGGGGGVEAATGVSSSSKMAKPSSSSSQHHPKNFEFLQQSQSQSFNAPQQQQQTTFYGPLDPRDEAMDPRVRREVMRAAEYAPPSDLLSRIARRLLSKATDLSIEPEAEAEGEGGAEGGHPNNTAALCRPPIGVLEAFAATHGNFEAGGAGGGDWGDDDNGRRPSVSLQHTPPPQKHGGDPATAAVTAAANARSAALVSKEMDTLKRSKSLGRMLRHAQQRVAALRDAALQRQAESEPYAPFGGFARRLGALLMIASPLSQTSQKQQQKHHSGEKERVAAESFAASLQTTVAALRSRDQRALQRQARGLNRAEVVDLEEWMRLLNEDTTPLRQLYRFLEYEYMALPPFLQLYKTAVLLPAVLMAPGSLAQLAASAAVEVGFGVFIFYSRPYVSAWVDVLYRAASAHAIALIGLAAVGRATAAARGGGNNNGGSSDEDGSGGATIAGTAMTVATSVYLAFVVCILGASTVWPIVQFGLRQASVERRLGRVGMRVSDLASLLLNPFAHFGRSVAPCEMHSLMTTKEKARSGWRIVDESQKEREKEEEEMGIEARAAEEEQAAALSKGRSATTNNKNDSAVSRFISFVLCRGGKSKRPRTSNNDLEGSRDASAAEAAELRRRVLREVLRRQLAAVGAPLGTDEGLLTAALLPAVDNTVAAPSLTSGQ